ncbi:MAG: type II secretion system major pseudopilin GspG [Alcaligenaceae bacterium]|nr:type II secretion system major pseudopilin GspG [Alcaligenaceae bacterium]
MSSHSSQAVASQSQRGFSLIEIMVVIVIMGIMAALVVPNLLNRPDQARAIAAKQDILAISQALKLYRLDNGRYPTTEQGLDALRTKPTIPPVPHNWQPYLDRLPMDPWGNPYHYLNPGVHVEVDVFSFGADGVAGGEGVNSDIGSWQ